MGANQGREAGGGKRKKGKGGAKEPERAGGGSGTKARAPSNSPQPKRVGAAGEGQQPRAHPPSADHAPAATHAAAPTHPPFDDEHSHPFHAPLDHVREEERPLHALSDATHFDVATLRKLQVIFTDIAESELDDGIIDANELTDAMGLKASCLLARTIFRIFDITHQKKIDFAMWVKTISALSEKASLEEKIKFSFSLYDLNGDGSIDVEELRAMLEAAVKDENVLNLTDAQVSEWCAHTLSQVDRDGNGKVDYEEYRSMVSSSVKFLESFTLDISALCSSFRFKKVGARSGDKLTRTEMDQRLNWFRARQRTQDGSASASGTSGESGSQHEDGSSTSEHQPHHAHAQLPSSGGKGHSSIVSVAGVHAGSGAAIAAAKLGGPGLSREHSRTPPRSGSGTIKSTGSLHKPIVIEPVLARGTGPSTHPPLPEFVSNNSNVQVTLQPLSDTSSQQSHLSQLAVMSSSHRSTASSASNGSPLSSTGPRFHDGTESESSPSPTNASAATTPAAAAQQQPHMAQAAASSGHSSVHVATSVTGHGTASASASVSAADEPAASSSSLPSRPPALNAHTHSADAPSLAEAAPLSRSTATTATRQHSLPLSTGPHSAHYVAAHTPLHLLRQTSVAASGAPDDEHVDTYGALSPEQRNTDQQQ